MKIPLSKRLTACLHMIQPGSRVADVGCDHGYLSISLISAGIASYVYASDVNEMPLKSGKENALRFGVSDKIEFFLSDGLKKVPHDFDTVVCAGMGADTIMGILEAAPWLKSEQYTLILQCQSKRPDLRAYLNRNGYRISKETLVRDGRFIYTIMEVHYGDPETISRAETYISKALLKSDSPLLPEFMNWVIKGLQESLNGLLRSENPKEDPEDYRVLIDDIKRMEDMIHDHS